MSKGAESPYHPVTLPPTHPHTPTTAGGRLLRLGGRLAWNMALDEALLTCGSRADGPPRPVLRFYTWTGPAVTLGRFQQAGSVDLVLCQARGIAVVRRPTGGRAVYHDTDLTYSLLFPETLLGRSSIRASYARLTAAMGAVLADRPFLPLSGRTLAEHWIAAGSRPESAAPRGDCFAHVAAADVTLEGRKVIGSAQVRRGGWVLQQGSIRLWPQSAPRGLFVAAPDAGSDPPTLPAGGAGYEAESPGKTGEARASSGVEMTEMPPRLERYREQYREVERRVVDALAVLFGCGWEVDAPAEEETELALRLEEGKYLTDEWNRLGKEPLCRQDS